MKALCQACGQMVDARLAGLLVHDCKTKKYAHVTIEIRLVAHGVQVDMFDRTLSTPDGQGIKHRQELWDFADDNPSICSRAEAMQEAIYQALRKIN